MWRSSSCSKRRRLNRPVRASCSAMWRSRASAAVRSRLELARVGHVDPGADHVRDLAVRPGQRGGGPLDQPQVAVARAPVELGAHGRLAGAQRSHAVLGDVPLVGRDQVEQRVRRLQLGGAVAEQRLAGAVPPDEPAVERRRRRSARRPRRAPHRGARCPQTRGSYRAGGHHRATRIARHKRFACRVRQTFSPHGPEAARRPPRRDRASRPSAPARSGSGRRAAPTPTTR